MLLVFLKFVGRVCALLPESWVRGFCRALGLLVGVALPSRRRSALGNLHHAFPEKSEAWRRQVYRESCARLFEMALFLPASAYFYERRLNSLLEWDPEAKRIVDSYCDNGKAKGEPFVLLLPHMTLSEATTILPRKLNNFPTVHVIFRPLNQPSVNAWITAVRSRFGAKLLSRRDGYNDAMAALRRGEGVCVLFDQDASRRGTTVTFMNRLASVTDLPGLMAKRFDAAVYLLLPERQAFWRARLTLTRLPGFETPTEVAIRAHQHLETYLRRDADSAADWLWLHDRWSHQNAFHKRFRLGTKRNQLALSNQLHGYSETPRATRLWVRMPNWLGDVVMALPLLRALRRGRPDFEITLIGKSAFRPLFERLGVGDRFISLPSSGATGAGYFRFFHQRRLDYPDTYLLFTNSFRGDFEAFLTRCPQRFGLLRPGKRRPLLTRGYPLPETVDETAVHQTEVWEKMFRYYGLVEPLDFAPLASVPRSATPGTEASDRVRIGLICGTENSPEKRWPVGHWRELLEKLLGESGNFEFVLYGTRMDRAITDAVADGFDAARVLNRAGETDLDAFCDGLAGCRIVVCNDTGGMHLANLLGTPVVGVFGPTNPVRTGPIFDAPKAILQPSGCPATGGAAISEVAPERVVEAVKDLLEKGAAR